MGFFDKLKLTKLREGLQKTHDEFVRKINRVFYQSRKIDDELMAQIEETLLGSDAGVATTDRIIAHLVHQIQFKKWSEASQLRDELRSQISDALTRNGELRLPDDPFAIPSDKRPYVQLIVGVNGVGKTTTIGKLAYNYRSAGKKVIIGAADTFRAAANQQLEVWAQRAGVDIIQQHAGADPSAVAFDTLQSAISKDADVVLIDTAGRLHNKQHLMQELEKMTRVMRKLLPEAPHEVLLVLDATTGQNALQQAREFTKVAPITGLVLTKLDGTAKGGIVIALTNELRVPVRYIGVGETIEDLQPFDPAEFAKAMFGDSTFQEVVTSNE
ncbi:MAG: signal recognition particle-docking protein FtsY [Bacteroidota bacterium]|nr:signal recognition particle-docking protein FtsY [Bacteroidota bacterium]MDP4231930.1 signal recognition particle-docking protein FtsY [Bacteroidota bacterium]MDP4241363.1 signal recognition particle-docking protein FtsY [Bacteroidota bacterium]MDP4287286.1 signal recognition particle-docking protein FtsY [Bacteroidota bacterium]